jgi:MYXO-CTERM domain-containing protein
MRMPARLSTAFVSCLLAFSASSASAAEWAKPSVELEASPDAITAARRWLDGERARLGLAGVELGGDRVLGRDRARRTVRLEQRHRGVRVLGGGVAVRVGSSGRAELAAIDVARGLEVDTTPTLSAERALAALERARGASLPRAERAELVVLPTDRGQLAWLLDLRVGMGGTRFVVDAHTGTLVQERPLAVHAMGRVYSYNAVSTPTPVDVDLATLDEAADPVRLNGWGGLLAVTNYVSGGSQSGFELEQTLGPSSGVDFLYDPPTNPLDPTDGFAQVNLFHHLTTIRELFRELGVPVDDAAYELTAVANAREDGQNFDNAFFSPMGQDGPFAAPNLIAIGQGTQVDFAYDSDVFKHEFGHYVTHVALGYNLGQLHFDAYGLSPHSGSIDEGIADYFACSQNGDAVVGEASLAVLGAARDLEAIDKKCPDDVVGQVHMDGEIVGALSWKVREQIGPALGDRLVWSALEMLTPGARLGDFGEAIIGAAEELEAGSEIAASDLIAIRAAVAEYGLDDCGAVLALEGDEARRGTIIGLGILAQAFGASCQQVKGFGVSMPSLFHFSRATSPSDPGLRLTIDADAVQGAGEIDLRVFARKGQPVRFSSGQGGFPVPSQFDHEIVVESTGVVQIDASSDPPFEPGAEYHFVLVSNSCPTVSYALGASVSEPAGTGGGGVGGAGGAGAGGDDDGGEGPTPSEEDGCACRAAVGGGGDGAGGVAALALGVALAWRRRRSASLR